MRLCARGFAHHTCAQDGHGRTVLRMQGSWCAGKGAGQAFRASMASQLPTLRCLASWLPEIILGSAVFKPLQVLQRCTVCPGFLDELYIGRHRSWAIRGMRCHLEGRSQSQVKQQG